MKAFQKIVVLFYKGMYLCCSATMLPCFVEALFGPQQGEIDGETVGDFIFLGSKIKILEKKRELLYKDK